MSRRSDPVGFPRITNENRLCSFLNKEFPGAGSFFKWCDLSALTRNSPARDNRYRWLTADGDS